MPHTFQEIMVVLCLAVIFFDKKAKAFKYNTLFVIYQQWKASEFFKVAIKIRTHYDTFYKKSVSY